MKCNNLLFDNEMVYLENRFDRTLGGFEFQLRLRDHLAKLFDKSKKTKMDLYSNDRAMAKLFKEAGRLMKVLSANTAHVSQVSNFNPCQYSYSRTPLVRTPCRPWTFCSTGPENEGP